MLSIINTVLARVWSQVGDMELYTCIILIILIAVWIFGSISNRSIARRHFASLAPALEAQFAVPGELLKESNSHYFVYSSGRVGCNGMTTSIFLNPRQDFLGRFVMSWFARSWWSGDRVEIEVSGPGIDPATTLLICRKYQQKPFLKKFSEIEKFGKSANGVLRDGPFSRYSVSPLTGFGFIGDAGGKAIGSQVFGKNFSNQITKSILDNIEYIYISNEQKCMRFGFHVPADPSFWKGMID